MGRHGVRPLRISHIRRTRGSALYVKISPPLFHTGYTFMSCVQPAIRPTNPTDASNINRMCKARPRPIQWCCKHPNLANKRLRSYTMQPELTTGVFTAMEIRRLVSIIDETFGRIDRPGEPPRRRVAIIAVVKNPLAGRYDEDLTEMMKMGEQLAYTLAEKALQYVERGRVESFVKAAIVGVDGEIEHAAALIHPKFSVAVGQTIGGGKEIIPSTKKVGGPGTMISVQLQPPTGSAAGSLHLDAMEIRVPGAPRPDEIVVALALAESSQPQSSAGEPAKLAVAGQGGAG